MRGIRILVPTLLIALLIAAAAFFAFGGNRPNEQPIDDGMLRLEFDTAYTPLPNIGEEGIVERVLTGNQVVVDNTVLDKAAAEKMMPDDRYYLLATDGEGAVFVAATLTNSRGYDDISIAKYDADGNELQKKVYAGSDFESVHAVKFHPQIGLVIFGMSQSSDGDFPVEENTPFAACIDPITLAVQWMQPTQDAGSASVLTDDGVFVILRGEEPANGEALQLIVAKLDKNGNMLWKTEPLAQWVQWISVLQDGKVLVAQQFADNHGNAKDGLITVYNKDGDKKSYLHADCYGEMTPTDDGGFIMVSDRNIKTLPQPVYVSAIWYDTETVVTKYDANLKIQWRKTYDSHKDTVGGVTILPQVDGSLILADDI